MENYQQNDPDSVSTEELIEELRQISSRLEIRAKYYQQLTQELNSQHTDKPQEHLFL
ncbi:hypothetical protein DYBT9275_02408 [Dyadobacter sp. CECT 9275]|uniref:Uncharacterized protein n=1 Tax=Dyadobacter helix TaxID=2822344 RepID=A0A916JE27_9BACT|nr:hypothetical protein DYBT9275_02408 [Dyadobacter sp. CECT 9275]